jgi:hypothetical protein
MKLIKLPVLILVLTAFFACVNELDDEEKEEAANPNFPIEIIPPSSTSTYATAVQKVSFSGGTSVVNLPDLENNSIYLVKVNTSNMTVSAANTGKVLNMGVPEDVLAKNARNAVSVTQEQAPFMVGGGGDEPVSGIFMGPNGETIIRYEHHPNSEKIFDSINAVNLNAMSVSRSVGAEYSSNPPPGYTVGSSTKSFWTQDDSGNFTKIATTLRAAGTYSNVWVANANYNNSSSTNNDNKITTDRAKALADKFDIIYQKETPVFGFEKGGGLFNGTNYSGNGGVDGDPKIQILVYDIFGDFSSSQRGGVLGYFWRGDEFDMSGSNKAEIFYIDAHFTDLAPDAIYSTLAHEFQHMINFNVKELPAEKLTATWYNEMLSMLAEDLIDQFIEIDIENTGHPIKSRIPTFLSNYYKDPTNWNNNDVYASYANAYALGAYLVRNFGGVNFVKAVMSNSAFDAASLNLALANSGVNPLYTEVNSFKTAISRYGEALLLNQSSEKRPTGVLSFNNTVSDTLPSGKYTFTGFDLFSLENGYTIGDKKAKGPFVWDIAGNYPLEPHTVLLLSSSGWQNVTGSRSITLQQPANSNIEFHIIVR